jgi:hypothetical protein
MSIAKRYRQWLRFIWVMIIAHPSLNAQDLTNQTNIYVSQDLEIYFDGSVVNEGFIQHQGILSFTGSWTNTSVYQGSGTLAAVGANPQTISNNRQAVSKFLIDGIGIKRIVGFLPITNELTLLSGLVSTTSNDTLLLQQSALATGGSEISYVDGALFSAGSGYKFFPIGKNGNYNAVALNDITGINPVFSLEMFENIPTIQIPFRTNYFPAIYWKRTQVSGTFSSSPITIHYNIPERYTDSHEVEILQSVSLAEPFSALHDVDVVFQNGLDLVSTDDPLTGNFFVVGNSIPIGGVEGEFYFSTSLSPKASNKENSAIRVFGNKLDDEDFLFQVYNRWGLLVFESTSLQDMIDAGWDGTQKNGGNAVPAGAYPYLFKAKLKTGEVLEKKGVITLVY